MFIHILFIIIYIKEMSHEQKCSFINHEIGFINAAEVVVLDAYFRHW